MEFTHEQITEIISEITNGESGLTLGLTRSSKTTKNREKKKGSHFRNYL